MDTDTRQQSNFHLEPELSPLHNPLLAENLDRWARVYAAAYPENRSQAIQQLLQDLQSENVFAPEFISSALSHKISCPRCGKVKYPGQKFCGFCGAECTETTPTTEPQSVSSFTSLQSVKLGPSSSNVSRDLDSLRELSFSTFYDSHESNQNGWRYTLAILVIFGCLGTIAYVQWRTQIRTTWNNLVAPMVASNAPPPSPAPTADNVPPPPPAQATNTVQPDSQNVSVSPQEPLAAPEQPTRNSTDNQQTSDTNLDQSGTPEKSAPAHTVTPAAKRDPISSPAATTPVADNGSAELAVAQQYLNGTSGSRNSTQAATWLWKAVSKQNPTALVLLSDLYLRGDGVSKNCEQARLLLVTAAKKDAHDASAKLRSFETTGCR